MIDYLSLRELLTRHGRVSFRKISQFAISCESLEQFEKFYDTGSLLGTIAYDIPTGKPQRKRVNSDALYLFPLIKRKGRIGSVTRLSIGSAPDCDLMVPDSTIAPVHAQIYLRCGEFFISPAPSASIEIEGRIVKDGEVPLYDNNEIGLGRYIFTFISPRGLYVRLLPDEKISSQIKGITASENAQDSDEDNRPSSQEVSSASPSDEDAVPKFALYNVRAKSLFSEEERALALSYIQKLSVFAGFTPYQLKRLVAFESFIQHFKNRETIIREGDVGEHFYILLEGHVEAKRFSSHKPLWRFSPGELFGEASFFEGSRRSASIVSRGPSVVLTFNRTILDFLGVEIRERLKMLIITQMIARLNKHNKELMRYNASAYYPGEGGVWRGPVLTLLPKGPNRDHILTDQQMLRIIGRQDFFSVFNEYEKRRLSMQKQTTQYFPAQTMIIQQGATCTDLYIVLRGKVAVVFQADDEPPVILAYLSEGDLFGESAFLTNDPRTSSVVAEEESIVLRIDQHFMEQVGPEVREKFRDVIIQRLLKRTAFLNRELARYRLSFMISST
ncbi:cyclic nucleotide-binding domain-containing protein [Magnetococcales bacterium HHB-1]